MLLTMMWSRREPSKIKNMVRGKMLVRFPRKSRILGRIGPIEGSGLALLDAEIREIDAALRALRKRRALLVKQIQGETSRIAACPVRKPVPG